MQDGRVQRRLTAVLAADIAGYSRLMGLDEEGTHSRLRRLRADIIDPLVASHGGAVVKATGDGLLAELPSAVDALRCAVAIQQAAAAAETDMVFELRMALRIGIDIGDVIADRGDIFGDSVNIAARLEALAEPGGICVSGRVQDYARGQLDVALEDAGEHQLKNIVWPVRVYRVRPDVAALPGPPPPERPSIAVLPFENLSRDPGQDEFGDGLVEELITTLSRLRWLLVIARNSSFAYRGRVVDVRQVGRELGVRYVLEGTVRRAGRRVRITGQLIDVASGANLWAERFEGELDDLFALQDRVAAGVMTAIAPRLELAEIERASRKPTGSLDAYDHYLRGMAELNRWTLEANEAALRHFGEAYRLDPEFAAAYAMAARTYAQRKGFGWIADLQHERTEAIALARRAINLGCLDATALAGAGVALAFVGGDLDTGAECIERALALESNIAPVWLHAGWIKLWLGEPEPAIERLQEGLRRNPADPHVFTMYAGMGAAHFIAARYEEALSWAARAAWLRPEFSVSAAVIAASYALLGRQSEAQRAMEVLLRIFPDLRRRNLFDSFPLRRPDDRARWADALSLAGLPD